MSEYHIVQGKCPDAHEGYIVDSRSGEILLTETELSDAGFDIVTLSNSDEDTLESVVSTLWADSL